jgi:uncharacterized membrane protein YvbJ
MNKPHLSRSFTCPVCGAEVPENARACPECGSDEETGWSEEAWKQNLGIESYDREDYEWTLRRELGRVPRKEKMRRFILAAAAGIVLFLFAAYYLCR